MVGIHGVDLAEAGDVAVFDIHARDIVFTLRFGLGAVLLQVVHRCGRHPQAGALAGADTGAGVVEAQHIAVDGIAAQHKTGNILFCINGHLGDGSAQGGIALAGKADLHCRAQGLAVRTQQLFGLLCRAYTGVLPAEPGHQLAYAAIQRHLGVGVQIGLELLRALRQNVRSTGVQPSAAGSPDKVAGGGGEDLGGVAQLRLHSLCLLGKQRDLICKAGGIAGGDPELVLRQQIGIGTAVHIAVTGGVQCVQQIVQRTGALLEQTVQLGGCGILGALQQIDLAGELGQLLAQHRLIGVGVQLCNGSARRHPLAIRDKVAQIAAAGNAGLVKQQHAVRFNGIGDGDGQRRFVDVLGEKDVRRLPADIHCRRQQKGGHHNCQRGERRELVARFLRGFRHKDHPFDKKSWVRRRAVCRTSSAPASSHVTPSMWRNHVSWRLA